MKSRCNLIFRKQRIFPMRLVQTINADIQEWLMASRTQKAFSQPNPAHSRHHNLTCKGNVRSSNRDILKCNFDASFHIGSRITNAG